VDNWSRAWGYQINGPLWSVASEWQIYFFFPLVLLPVWRKAGMLPALLVAALLGYAPLALWPTSAATQVAITWYLLLFTFGMAAAAIGFSPDALATRVRARVPIAWICAGLWAFCLIFGWSFGPIWFRMKPLADLLVGLSTAVMLVYLTGRASAVGRARGTLLRFLESRPLVGIGHFSYSLYLTHLPVVALCYFTLRHRFAGPQLALALLAASFPTSLVLAYGFHVAVERRFIRR
jgi:peptidoglycan/LPS O-acetylase OafA/YrhL